MTGVSTATALAVNAAFLQEIKDSNPDLWVAVQSLRDACRIDDQPALVCRRITRMLDNLRDSVAFQFSLEESYGYIAVYEPMDETLADLAALAQSQHGPLYLQLSDLAEQAEELQYRGVEREQLARLIEQTLEFDEKLSRHEKMEAELIARSCKVIRR